MFAIINTILIVATIVAIYWFWIRPVLAKTPGLKELYEKEYSWFKAFADKLAGAKQKLTAAFLTFTSFVVMFYDSIVPAMTGVDVTPLVQHIPQWAYPLILIAVTFVLNYFRSLADKRHLKELEELKDQITPK